jgi:hypothetical protein
MLIVSEFTPRDTSLLVFQKVTKTNANEPSSFCNAYSPPLGIDFNQVSSEDIKLKLESHVNEIASDQRNDGEVKWGAMSQLTWDVYEAIRCYQNTCPEVSTIPISSLLSFAYKLMEKIAERAFTEDLKTFRHAGLHGNEHCAVRKVVHGDPQQTPTPHANELRANTIPALHRHPT